MNNRAYKNHTQPVILRAEDDEHISCLLDHLLQRQGYHVVPANNGMELLDLIKDRLPPDLVLLDIHMPIMDGVTVLEKIKNDDGLLDIPVVMLTAIDNMNVVHQCLRKGACGYVTKPFNMELLNQQIQHCLG